MDLSLYQNELEKIEQICLAKNLITNGKCLLIIITDNINSNHLVDEEDIKKALENCVYSPYYDEDVVKGKKVDPNKKLNIEKIDTLLRIDTIVKFCIVPISYTENAKACTKVAHLLKTLGYNNVILGYDISLELDREKLVRHLVQAHYNVNNFASTPDINIAYLELNRINES